MLPDHWGAMPGAKHHGFRYADVADSPGVRRMTIGDDGYRMLYAMNAAIEAILRCGQSVIVDGQIYSPEVNQDLEYRLGLLRDTHVAGFGIVELIASDAALLDRQERHEHPVGLSLHHNRQPPQSCSPSLRVDTTGKTASDVADFVWQWLREDYPPVVGFATSTAQHG